MRLTAVWSEVTGEGRLMAGQVKALRRRAAATISGNVDVLDFLVDARHDIDRLYQEILATDEPPFPKRAEARVARAAKKRGGK